MNTSKSRIRSTVLLSVLTFGLSACAACGPNLAGEADDGTGGSGDGGSGPSLVVRDAGMGCGSYSNCDDSEPPADGGTTQYTTVHVIMKNPTAVAKDMRTWGSGTVGWPVTTVAQWSSPTVTLQPGQVLTYSSVMRIPYGGKLAMDNKVWEQSPENYSGRGWGPNMVSTPSVTCVAEVSPAGWPNAAAITCASP